jgi:hypothetical protein
MAGQNKGRKCGKSVCKSRKKKKEVRALPKKPLKLFCALSLSLSVKVSRSLSLSALGSLSLSLSECSLFPLGPRPRKEREESARRTGHTKTILG